MPEEQAEYDTSARTDYYALARRTVNWARDKGIHDEGTPAAQADKLLEEAIETWAAVHALPDADIRELQEHAQIISDRDTGVVYYDEYARDADIRDGMGDVLVTLVNTAYAYLRACGKPGATYAASWLLICWADVLDEIEERTGEMRDGVFVKGEDL